MSSLVACVAFSGFLSNCRAMRSPFPLNSRFGPMMVFADVWGLGPGAFPLAGTGVFLGECFLMRETSASSNQTSFFA
eukprot:6165960-Amphidinium_carterae.1